MAGQTKLFQSLRKYFQILGTLSLESDENPSINPRNAFVLFCYIQLFISSVAFTMFEAETVTDYGLNYYAYTSELLCVFVISTQIRRMAIISTFIENCEEFIARSK